MSRRITRAMAMTRTRKNDHEEAPPTESNDSINEKAGSEYERETEPTTIRTSAEIPCTEEPILPRKERATWRKERQNDTAVIAKEISPEGYGSTTGNRVSHVTDLAAPPSRTEERTKLQSTTSEEISNSGSPDEVQAAGSTGQTRVSTPGIRTKSIRTTSSSKKRRNDRRDWWNSYAVMGSISKDSELRKLEEAEEKLKRNRLRKDNLRHNGRSNMSNENDVTRFQPPVTQTEENETRERSQISEATNPVFCCTGIKTAEEQQDVTEKLMQLSRRRRRRHRERNTHKPGTAEAPETNSRRHVIASEMIETERSKTERSHCSQDPQNEETSSDPTPSDCIEESNSRHPAPNDRSGKRPTEQTNDVDSPSLQAPLPQPQSRPPRNAAPPSADVEPMITDITSQEGKSEGRVSEDTDRVAVKAPLLSNMEGPFDVVLPRRVGIRQGQPSSPIELQQKSRISDPTAKLPSPDDTPNLRNIPHPRRNRMEEQDRIHSTTFSLRQGPIPAIRNTISQQLAALPSSREPVSIRGNIGDDISLRLILSESGLPPLRRACYLAMGIQDRVIDINDVTPFDEGESVMQKWRSAWIHEIAAGVLSDARRRSHEYVPYKATCREKLNDGGFVEVLSATSRPRAEKSLRKYDVIMHSTHDDIRMLTVCMGSNGERGLQGFPMVVLHYYDEYEAGDVSLIGMYRVTNLGNDFSIYRSLSRKTETGLPSTISVFAEQKEDVMSTLKEQRMNFLLRGKGKLLTTPGSALPARLRRSVSHNIASKYVEELGKHDFVNRDQEKVIMSALAMQQYWEHTEPGERREMNRFILVSGVPGCGKTYTAAFIITAILCCYDHTIIDEKVTRASNATIMVCTKTNKALEVFMERLGTIDVPRRDNFNSWGKKGFRFYCKRSATYMRREGDYNPRYKGLLEEPDCVKGVPVILSTFGNLEHVRNDWYHAFDKAYPCQNFMDYVKLYFKTLIIDEGSQSTLLDLLHFVTMFPTFDGIVIILGDPLQMGPIVLCSMTEIKEFLSKSLFTQLSDQSNVAMVQEYSLTYQYRMHPEIMSFVNDIRYNGEMRYGHPMGHHDHRSVPRICKRLEIPGEECNLVLGPIVAYDTSDAPREMFSFRNYQNWDELTVAAAIIDSMKLAGYEKDDNFVFLSPYNEQCTAMRRICRNLGWEIPSSTVASYQGHDKSVVIYSAARRSGSGIGFLDDDRMVTVSFTRAKDSLIIIGDLGHISRCANDCSIWTKVMESLASRNAPVVQAERVLQIDSVAIDTIRSIRPVFHPHR